MQNYLKDPRFASRFFKLRDATLDGIPRHKFMFWTNWVRAAGEGGPRNYGRWEDGVSFLVKSVEKPRINFANETLSQYNKKRVVQTKIDYQPIRMSFYDTYDDRFLKMFLEYFKYYYADPNAQTGAAWTPDTVFSEFNIVDEGRGVGFVPPYLDVASGQRVANTGNFFERLEIVQFGSNYFTEFWLINPKIVSYDPDDYDHTDINTPAVTNISVAYESIVWSAVNEPLNERIAQRLQNPEHTSGSPTGGPTNGPDGANNMRFRYQRGKVTELSGSRFNEPMPSGSYPPENSIFAQATGGANSNGFEADFLTSGDPANINPNLLKPANVPSQTSFGDAFDQIAAATGSTNLGSIFPSGGAENVVTRGNAFNAINNGFASVTSSVGPAGQSLMQSVSSSFGGANFGQDSSILSTAMDKIGGLVGLSDDSNLGFNGVGPIGLPISQIVPQNFRLPTNSEFSSLKPVFNINGAQVYQSAPQNYFYNNTPTSNGSWFDVGLGGAQSLGYRDQRTTASVVNALINSSRATGRSPMDYVKTALVGAVINGAASGMSNQSMGAINRDLPPGTSYGWSGPNTGQTITWNNPDNYQQGKTSSWPQVRDINPGTHGAVNTSLSNTTNMQANIAIELAQMAKKLQGPI